MKAFIAVCALLTFVVVPAYAQSIPNYAGTWALDKAKSKGVREGLDIKLEIKQDTQRITLKTTYDDGAGPLSIFERAFELNGAKTKAERYGNDLTLYVEKKSDGNFVFHTEYKHPDADPFTSLETLTLSGGGKSLEYKDIRGKKQIQYFFNKRG